MTDDAFDDKSRLALLWFSWRRRLCEENDDDDAFVVVVVVVRASIIVVIVFEEASRTIMMPMCIDGVVTLCARNKSRIFFLRCFGTTSGVQKSPPLRETHTQKYDCF